MNVIAIDGPAGAGKSTIARALAARLGLEYLDTGAMYRAVTLAAMNRGVPLEDAIAIADLARSLALDVGEHGVLVDGVDSSADIRRADVTASVAAVASNSAVREELRARQRHWADDRGGGVIEGRDIGSVVFPEARIKLYLTASPATRAARRVAESGGDVVEIERAIAQRDASDAARADGPLAEMPDAIVVDTTGLGIDEVLDMIEELLESAG